MDAARIAELLRPFLAANGAPLSSDVCHSEEQSDKEPAFLSTAQLQSISTYIDILRRWNARINLTAVRNEEEIVTRHFGESLFAARILFPSASSPSAIQAPDSSCSLADIGAGAGFPGIPIKLWAPQISLTLIEANHKKATFLREIARALTLTNINIQTTRAEDFVNPRATNQPATNHDAVKRPPGFDVVTLRAVERFPKILPIAAALVAPGGRLALFIGSAQQESVHIALPTLNWQSPRKVPLSESRLILVGTDEPIE